jgi:DNA primase catalytic subunit
LSHQETREEENLRRRIEELREEERALREKRQAMESQLRKLVWHRMIKKVETVETIPSQCN